MKLYSFKYVSANKITMSLWKRFRDRYPNADESKFKTIDFCGAKTSMFVGKDETIDVFDGNSFRSSIYFSDEMKIALGLASGFPLELTLNPKSKLSIPAIQFSDKSKTRPLAEALINQKIYVTPEQYFNCKFRDMITHTQITHNSGKESHKWLSRPEISYWNQQLNFAIFCSTTASGLSNRLFLEDKMLLEFNSNLLFSILLKIINFFFSKMDKNEVAELFFIVEELENTESELTETHYLRKRRKKTKFIVLRKE